MDSFGNTASPVTKQPGNKSFEPRYLELHRSGELKRRGNILWEMMNICDLCPRECENNRLDGQKGDCGSTSRLMISSFNPHFGEEESLVGDGGSGTIFMTHCSLRCVYCINWQISREGRGENRNIDELASMMLRLQNIGCKNINVVTPTHYSPHILLALDKAAKQGLRIPLVYNTSGYEKVEVLKLLDGVVDIYLPDFKYFQSSMAAKYSSGAREYPEMAKAALLEMHRQVGVARPADNGLMYKGLMIRHLVLPNGVSGTKDVIEWVARILPKDTYFHLMAQYQPAYEADQYSQINRRITRREYQEAVSHAQKMGLANLDVQG
ncbi:MAG: radical SAM protein, partial [Bacteroidales bacterium]|nr:radical SAM protein [Bacteroidales bacterium]